MKIFEARQETDQRYTIFSDLRPAIWRAMADALGPGQQWDRVTIEVGTRLAAKNNEVSVMWVPAHKGVAGNEFMDGLAKEAAGGRPRDDLEEVPDKIRWQASLPHLSRQATEGRARDATQWITAHVRPERRYCTGPQVARVSAARLCEKSGNPLAGRYYRLLLSHAAIGSFLHERMTGPLRRESSECRWCASDKRELRHHLFTKRQA